MNLGLKTTIFVEKLSNLTTLSYMTTLSYSSFSRTDVLGEYTFEFPSMTEEYLEEFPLRSWADVSVRENEEYDNVVIYDNISMKMAVF